MITPQPKQDSVAQPSGLSRRSFVNKAATGGLVLGSLFKSVEEEVACATQTVNRSSSPSGLKITDRAFGTGWRMPIAAKIDL